ncbi:D-2-hydroxyacid dehydrogenase [Confluentibacter flavum]|uniref:Glycerate dehydrogenase n=1 Tax=Confluentibacter flavum TaxID=1909700 RepID=A0A2N3HK75_9FLAO|nr:D-2-hydroxyacid dehydrogenase [Confluentibacter flavum]PKQ45375.1 glycerate dehydrogenase [Confluentibacter flavum]
MKKLKIVVLDGYTLNPGDLNWDSLKKLGDVTIYDRTPSNLILQRCEGADVLFTNKTILDEITLNNLPSLKYIGVLATGYNVVNTEVAKKNNIMVTNVPGYGTTSVVQMTFALLLELCHHVQYHSDSVMNGKWSASNDWCYWDYPLVELAGKTMGIIGFGNIGQKVADVAMAFGMNILVVDKNKSDQSKGNNIRWVENQELFEKSDVISIHCPLFPETKGLINKENLRKMKKSAFIINTSRGPIIIDRDLAEALINGTIAGAAIDVLSVEPPEANNPLYNAPNCIITPHIAWATKEARARLMVIAINNLSAFIKGEQINRIN